MERVNTFLAERPWLQVALSVLAASALVLIIFPGESASSALFRTASASVGGVGVLVFFRRKEKRAAGGTTNRLVSLDAKLRKGEVPAEPAEREAMRDLIGQRLHRMRHRVPALVTLVVLFGATTAMTAVTFGPRETVGLALLSVVFIGWLSWYGGVQIRRMHRMRDALDDTADRHA
ncbi:MULTISPECIES: hypothetical protein [Streptomyces]|nr:hypothetical protein [Streptomyces ruber]